MKLLAEISDKSLGIGSGERFDKPYLLRKAARAVLLNEDGAMAFQNVSNCGYHKLPGGGVDKGEEIKNALEREILEEVGCKSIIGDEIGMIIEYRNGLGVLQISYCYFAEVSGEVGKPSYEEGEIKEGHKPIWTSLHEAMMFLDGDKPTTYDGKFIVVRDRILLETAKKILAEN